MRTFKTGEVAEINLWTDHLVNTAADLYQRGYPAAAAPYAVAAYQGQLRLNQLLQVELSQSEDLNN
jgi:hypothetical protein